MNRTSAQLGVLHRYRAERRDGYDPKLAAQLVRGTIANHIARLATHRHLPTRAVMDQWRVADQLVATVAVQIDARGQRNPYRTLRLVRTLRDANRVAVAS